MKLSKDIEKVREEREITADEVATNKAVAQMELQKIKMKVNDIDTSQNMHRPQSSRPTSRGTSMLTPSIQRNMTPHKKLDVQRLKVPTSVHIVNNIVTEPKLKMKKPKVSKHGPSFDSITRADSNIFPQLSQNRPQSQMHHAFVDKRITGDYD